MFLPSASSNPRVYINSQFTNPFSFFSHLIFKLVYLFFFIPIKTRLWWFSFLIFGYLITENKLFLSIFPKLPFENPFFHPFAINYSNLNSRDFCQRVSVCGTFVGRRNWLLMRHQRKPPRITMCVSFFSTLLEKQFWIYPKNYFFFLFNIIYLFVKNNE